MQLVKSTSASRISYSENVLISKVYENFVHLVTRKIKCLTRICKAAANKLISYTVLCMKLILNYKTIKAQLIHC